MLFNRVKSIRTTVIKAFNIHPLQSAFLVLFPLGVFGLNFFVHPHSLSEVEALSQHSPVVCLFHYLTGFLCPGCGMTRSLIGFFTGHLGISFHFNPFGPLLGISLTAMWLRSVMAKDLTSFFFHIRKVAPLLTMVLVSWGIYRNL